MDILIISIDHYTQLVEAETDSDQHRAQKYALRNLLQSHLEERKTAVVFEESSPTKMSIACQLANLNNPPIPWCNINMTDDERREAGILEALQDRPHHLIWGDGPVPILIQDRIPADAVREKYFVDRILEARESDGDVVVLVGNEHGTPVTELLRAKGHNVDHRR